MGGKNPPRTTQKGRKNIKYLIDHVFKPKNLGGMQHIIERRNDLQRQTILCLKTQSSTFFYFSQ